MSASAAVLALTLLKSRIYQQLVEIVAASSFYKFVVDPATGFPTTVKSVGYEIRPAGFAAMETAGAFEEGALGRKREMDRTGYRWQLRLEFNAPAMLEMFEDGLMDLDATSIPATPGLSMPQLDIRVQDVVYTHPQLQQGGNGTVAVYTLLVTPTRS